MLNNVLTNSISIVFKAKSNKINRLDQKKETRKIIREMEQDIFEKNAKKLARIVDSFFVMDYEYFLKKLIKSGNILAGDSYAEIKESSSGSKYLSFQVPSSEGLIYDTIDFSSFETKKLLDEFNKINSARHPDKIKLFDSLQTSLIDILKSS